MENKVRTTTILRVVLCVLIAFAVVSVFTLDTSYGAAKFKKSKVTGVKAAPAKEGKVQVSWKKKSGASGYLVYVSAKKNGGFKRKATGSASASSVKISGLAPGKTLYFKVRAYQKLKGKTKYGKYSKVVKLVIPPAVSVEAVRGTTSQMRVSFTASRGAKGYEVYRSANGHYAKVATLAGTARVFVDSGLTANKTYKYKVRAWTTQKKKKKKEYTAFSAIDYDLTGGNSKIYDLSRVGRQANSKLTGKRILFLGSSVTNGSRSENVSFVDYLQKKCGIKAEKNAVNGTTIVRGKRDPSYVERLSKVRKNDERKLVVCQLSSNDARTGIMSPIKDAAAVEATDSGAMTLTEAEEAGLVNVGEDGNVVKLNEEGGSDQPESRIFDDPDELWNEADTVEGGIKYIIAYSRHVLNCPVAFYILPKFDQYGSFDPVAYAELREVLLQIQKEWNEDGKYEKDGYKIEVLDMWGNPPFGYSSLEEKNCCYFRDGVHPYKAGYLDKFTPAFETFLKGIMK